MGAFAGALGGAVLLAVLLAGASLVAVVAVRGRGDDGATVRVAQVVAIVWTAIAVVGGVVAIIAALASPQVAITIPVEEHWPQLPAGASVDGTTATRVGGGFTSATVVAEGLGVATRVCWAIGQGLAWLVPGAVAALIAVTCAHLRQGRPFAPVIARMTATTAAVVLVGGIGMQVLGDIAGSMASHELLAWTGAQWEGDGDPATLLPAATLAIELPFWPIGAGLGLAALAAVLRQGDRLVRDTEGLV